MIQDTITSIINTLTSDAVARQNRLFLAMLRAEAKYRAAILDSPEAIRKPGVALWNYISSRLESYPVEISPPVAWSVQHDRLIVGIAVDFNKDFQYYILSSRWPDSPKNGAWLMELEFACVEELDTQLQRLQAAIEACLKCRN